MHHNQIHVGRMRLHAVLTFRLALSLPYLTLFKRYALKDFYTYRVRYVHLLCSRACNVSGGIVANSVSVLILAPFLSTTSWRRKTWPSLHRRMATRRENALSWSIWSIHRATLTFRPKWRLPWESRMEPWWLWIACPVRFTYSRSWSIHFLSISVLSYSSVLDDVWLLCFGTSDFMNWLHVLELVLTCFALKILKRCTFTWISIEWNALRTRHHVSSLLMPTMRRSWVKYVWYLTRLLDH